MTPSQLETYFRRIDLEQPDSPTLESLTDIMWAHLSHIPFDALDPVFYKRVPALDIDSLYSKMLAGCRGGYCFEQNSVLLDVLRSLGYDVYPVAARVVWHLNPGDPLPPISHMGLVVNVNGVPHYCDVGYGGPCSKAPLALTEGLHTVRGEDFRVRMEPGENGRTAIWIERPWAESETGYKPTLLFEDAPEPPDNFNAYNESVAGNPMSPFSLIWVVNIYTEDGSKSLTDNVLTIKTADGETVTELPDETAKREVLAREFGIVLE